MPFKNIFKIIYAEAEIVRTLYFFNMIKHLLESKQVFIVLG